MNIRIIIQNKEQIKWEGGGAFPFCVLIGSVYEIIHVAFDRRKTRKRF